MATVSSYHIEYEIFRSFYDCLHEGIQLELDQLIPATFAKKLIGSSTKEEAQLLTRTVSQRTSTLLSAIDRRIRTDPPAFYILMRILRCVPSLGYLAEKLREKLVEPSQRGRISIESGGSSMRQDQPVYGSMPTPSSTLPQSTLVLGSVQPERRNVCFQLNQTSLAIIDPRLTLEKVICDSRVSEEQLSQECDDIPLAGIASRISDWQTIHMHLGITDLELEDICHEHHSPLRQRQVLLQKWKQKHAHLATYKELAKCFCNANRLDLVHLVCCVISSQSEDEVIDDATTVARTVAHEQWPADLSCHNTPAADMTVPFPKQKSQQQGLLSPTTDTPLPRIIRTQSDPDAPNLQENEFYQHNPNSEIPQRENSRCKHASVISLSDSATNYSVLPSPTKSPSLSTRTSSSDSVVNSFKSACSHFTVSKESISENSEGDSADEGLKREIDQMAEKCKEKLDKKTQQVRILKEKLDKLKIKYEEKEEALRAAKQQLSEQQQLLLTLMQYPHQEAEPSTNEIDALRKQLELTTSYLQEIDAERKALESELSRAEHERIQIHSLKEKNWKLQCKVVELNMQVRNQDQTIAQHDKTIAKLIQEIQDLKFSFEFINSCERSCERRRSSI